MIVFNFYLFINDLFSKSVFFLQKMGKLPMTDVCTTGLVFKVGLENGTYQINVFITVYFIHILT